ncbi:1,4-dihydroxy-2-naphthoate polyprenyltransferase [Corynebacterium sp.]|uniref:1,4-dihydroxy-2-naphthoate polyprenyltransferase n=1 Tax=Corynebacterium sp. TaxID=1720 RepID=UPI0026DC6993|nr:1,4-dihydroxy-2-naphthoate polyprenyltransferase [Corynebacterium sp.]MDO4609928.1 1,4-dihydroxy-2-naphthoate polyprenyltransferase [Corynebacterium sp.]
MTDSRRTATFSDWLEGARPHTWANAVSPVVAGIGAAAASGDVSWVRAMLALVVAWALIVGVNFANDYSDGIRGTDDSRSGPLRLTGSGLVAPGVVKRAAFGCLGVAAVAGLILSLMSAWWLVLVGAACILGAWFYTGGRNPYGYRGLGEIAVFVFFGLVAVLGTQFTQIGAVTWTGLVAAVAIGSMSASVNLANNIRDIPTDAATGKITLAVRLGDRASRRLWLILACAPLAASIILAFLATPWALLGLVTAPLLAMAAPPVVTGLGGPALIPVLGLTGRAMLTWAVVTALAIGL